jgi:hypothetical protein
VTTRWTTRRQYKPARITYTCIPPDPPLIPRLVPTTPHPKNTNARSTSQTSLWSFVVFVCFVFAFPSSRLPNSVSKSSTRTTACPRSEARSSRLSLPLTN